MFIAGVCDFIEAQNLHCFQYEGSKNIAIVDRPLTCPEEVSSSDNQLARARLPGQQKGMKGDTGENGPHSDIRLLM